ncbi:MAG: FtsX-like permease family protein, partial [Spirochaetota bacterium]
ALFFALRVLGSSSVKSRTPAVSTLRGRNPQGTRYLRGAIIGIALSLIPFIVVLVVADGMIEGITSRYLETYAYHFQATPLEPLDLKELVSSAEEIGTRIPDVLGVWPEIRGAAVALYNGESAPAMIRGIAPGLLKDEGTRRYLNVSSGSLTIGSGKVLVGKSLATALGIEVGERLSLLTTGIAGRENLPRATMFRVAGIVSAGYRDLDELWVFIPLEAAGRILPVQSRQGLIGVKVAHPFEDPEALRVALSNTLNGDRKVAGPGPIWAVRPWREVERNLFASFATTRSLLLVIMALTIGVAAANVSSALVMLVFERSRDIAILKSMGASNGFIVLAFLIAGGATGVLGTIIGIGIGAILAWRVNDLIAILEGFIGLVSRIGALILGTPPPQAPKLLDPAYYLERIPVRLDFAELLLVAAVSILLCLAVSTLPALRAARLPPLEIFRKS